MVHRITIPNVFTSPVVNYENAGRTVVARVPFFLFVDSFTNSTAGNLLRWRRRPRRLESEGATCRYWNPTQAGRPAAMRPVQFMRPLTLLCRPVWPPDHRHQCCVWNGWMDGWAPASAAPGCDSNVLNIGVGHKFVYLGAGACCYYVIHAPSKIGCFYYRR